MWPSSQVERSLHIAIAPTTVTEAGDKEDYLRNFVLQNAIALSLLVGICVPPVGAQNQRKLSADAEAMVNEASVPVIIRYKQMPTTRHQGNIRSHGGAVNRVLSQLPLIVASLPGSQLGAIASDPDVAYVSLDRPVRAHVAEYTAEPINAPAVWAQRQYGNGVGVAIVDSGVSGSVQDLGSGSNSSVVFRANFSPTSTSAGDKYGHGSAVAGLVAGDGADSTGPQDFRTFSGIAPGAKIVSLKALDDNGQGTDSSVIISIDAAILLKPFFNIRVLNLSLGRGIYESYKQDPLCRAVEAATRAGILVVVAAGNDGRDLNLNQEAYGTIESPGNDPYVLTVGAMKTNGTPSIADDTIASYSSKGPTFIDHVSKPDLVAPGNLVPSLKVPNSVLSVEDTFLTYYGDYQSYGNLQGVSPYYLPLSGTSMAAAVTSGAAAVLFGAYPQLSPTQAKAIFMESANKSEFPSTSQVVADGITYTANYDVFTIGAGYLDLNAAMQLAQSQTHFPSGDSLSPIAVFDPSTNNTYLQFTPTSLLGSTILWGSSETYGAQAFIAPASGSTILWGSGTPGSSTILWGSGTPGARRPRSAASRRSR